MIRHRELLFKMSAGDYPNMGKQRSKFHREVYKKAYPNDFDPAPITKLGDIQKVLNG